MLDDITLMGIADELVRARHTRIPVPLLSARHPEMTVEDSYAVQRVWRDRSLAEGRVPVGRKIGLTSRAMQMATGINEPDYGIVFDDQLFDSGAVFEWSEYTAARVEVELAFVLGAPIEGPRATILDVVRATEYVVPALEILDSRIEMEGRSIIDTIADNAALGAMVLGGRPVAIDDIDLRWVAAILSKNEVVEETGVAAGVLGQPAAGVQWLANKLHPHGDRLEAGEIILAGSFTRPIWVHPGDVVSADYGPLGVLTCRFQ